MSAQVVYLGCFRHIRKGRHLDAGSGHSKRGISGEAGLAGLAWAGYKAGRLRGRVGGGGCIVVAEFGLEGLHLLHADIVGRA